MPKCHKKIIFQFLTLSVITPRMRQLGIMTICEDRLYSERQSLKYFYDLSSAAYISR